MLWSTLTYVCLGLTDLVVEQALRALPSEGWKPLASGETVSVYSNATNKVPFPTTCVRCQFQCPAPPGEVVRYLQDLEARRERDFFFKEGRVVGEKQKTKLNFQAVMKTLSASEERSVLVSQQWEQDGKGNWTVIESPEGTHDLSGFTFPSFHVKAVPGGTESCVIALYRFEIRKVWKDRSGEAEDKLAEELMERFSKYAEHTYMSLVMLGGDDVIAPDAKPRAQPPSKLVTKPAAASPAAARQLPPPITPQGSPTKTPTTPVTPGSSNRKKGESGVGDLIEGAKYRWKKGELIGHGAIGKVYMGLNFETGEMMAVKQVQLGQQLGSQAADELKAMDQEIHIFSMISHPNLVRYYGMEKTEREVYIFLEYVSGGSILSMLKKFGSFSETMVCNFTAQIVDGLDYLHSQQICHRDIKAANILYSNDGVVKLADFGTSKKIADVANLSVGLKSLVGTPYMMAPEVIRQTGHSLPADIWSLACVIWEMATTKHPFTQYTDRMVAMYNIAHAKSPPEPPDVLSEAAKDFVRRCMQIDAKKRATTTELLSHVFIAQVERKTNLSSPASLGAHGAPSMLQPPRSRSRDATPSKDDFDSRRELSIVAEDDERETASRSRSRATAPVEFDGMESNSTGWGHAYVYAAAAGEVSSKAMSKARQMGSTGEGSSSAAVRPSILNGLPPDPFQNSARLPSGLVADLTSSDEDDLDQPARNPVRGLRDAGARTGGVGASASAKRSSQSKMPEPEEEDEDGYTREQCEILGRPFYAARPSVGSAAWGRAEKSDSDSDEGSEGSPLTANRAPAKGRRSNSNAPTSSKGKAAPGDAGAHYDFSSGSESD